MLLNKQLLQLVSGQIYQEILELMDPIENYLVNFT